MTRQTVVVYVTINAISESLAKDRVQKAVICLENSLRYADPAVHIEDAFEEVTK